MKLANPLSLLWLVDGVSVLQQVLAALDTREPVSESVFFVYVKPDVFS